MLTPNEIKRRAVDFTREHQNDNDEKSQAQNFWRDFLAVFGLSPQRIGVFEARAKTLRGTVGFIDFFWPGTLLVEHKSAGRDLEEALKQALDYCATGGLKDTELPRFVVVCDFGRFVLVELATGDRVEFALDQLPDNLHRFNFILGYEQRKYKDEDPVNIKAAELMGDLHNELRRFGYEGHQLELFLVRAMFMMFADDTGIFPKDHMTYYLEAKTRDDGGDFGTQLALIFQILNTAPDKRQKNLDEDLLIFPYVNGHLFEEVLPFPVFDAALRHIFLRCCWFNWALVSPAIFGSLFQSVMNPVERRSLGAHYTSEKNILKTIHGLFLDELEADFAKAANAKNERPLRALQERIAAIKLLDPACGCGNFLILAYRELRRLEIRIQRELRRISGSKTQALDIGWEHRGITVDHMYGIEIEEFPAQIARVALWIMDHLMNVELATGLGGYKRSVPLMVSPHIVHGNALLIDWREIVKPEELSYILGNPPFVGAHWMSSSQKEDIALAIGHVPNFGLIDFVGAWYIKAADFIKRTDIECAFVSTNSITQGEQVGALWGWLIPQGIHISFAHRTFKWTNEAKGNAAVHCVIVGFAMHNKPNKAIHIYETIASEPTAVIARNINPYLVDALDVWIGRRNDPICSVPEMVSGNQPIDDGNYLFKPEEKAVFLAKEPGAAQLFRRWLGGEEFINNIERWCLFVGDASPNLLKRLPETMKRIDAVRKFREESSRGATKKLARTPTQFQTTFAADSPYVAMPQVSSERRRYIPIAYLTPEFISGDKLRLVKSATLFHFGVLTSEMHMAWTRYTCGRLKSDYQYSAKIVYNNFPWPKGFTGGDRGSGGSATGEGVGRDLGPAAGAGAPTDIEKLKAKVENCAQGVLDARARYPEASLADLYDPLSMPPDLTRAHRDLDAAVDKCYRKEAFGSELERVEFLFALYEEYTAGLLAGMGNGKAKRKK